MTGNDNPFPYMPGDPVEAPKTDDDVAVVEPPAPVEETDQGKGEEEGKGKRFRK